MAWGEPKKPRKRLDVLVWLVYYLLTMRTEGYDPRDIVKAYASIYRDSELARMERNNYASWLQSHQSVEKKVEKSVGRGLTGSKSVVK